MSNKVYVSLAVQGMRLMKKNVRYLVEGTENFIGLKIEFIDNEWDGLNKFVLCYRDGEAKPFEIVNGEALVDNSAVATNGEFKVKVIGSDGAEVKAQTNIVTLQVNSSKFTGAEGGPLEYPTNDILSTALANTTKARDEAIASAYNAKQEADKAQAIVDNLPQQVDTYINDNREKLKGDNGKDGYTPIKGVDYFDGRDGRDGVDGYTPQKGIDYFDGKDGKDGEIPAEQLAQITTNAEAIATLQESKIDDVTINGSSVKNGTVANIPMASTTQAGVIQTYAGYGVGISNNRIRVTPATNTQLSNRSNDYNPITALNMDYAVKCSMGDGKGAEWGESFKQKARERLGIAIVTLTQAEYDALEVKSADTTYLVTESD